MKKKGCSLAGNGKDKRPGGWWQSKGKQGGREAARWSVATGLQKQTNSPAAWNILTAGYHEVKTQCPVKLEKDELHCEAPCRVPSLWPLSLLYHGVCESWFLVVFLNSNEGDCRSIQFRYMVNLSLSRPQSQPAFQQTLANGHKGYQGENMDGSLQIQHCC